MLVAANTPKHRRRIPPIEKFWPHRPQKRTRPATFEEWAAALMPMIHGR